MFDVDFTHASTSPLPPSASPEMAVKLLHDFDLVVKLNPDCKGCKAIPAPQAKAKALNINGGRPAGLAKGDMQYFEVEDDLPFMPKKLWSGGVKYIADFLPTEDGCDITVHAPGGFTSTNHWRILREQITEDGLPQLQRVASKDLMHADKGMGGWYVQIISDARCSRTFAGIVKGFLKASHSQLQTAFIGKLQASRQEQMSGRPTLGRRRSSYL
ncbi:hypothetical protein LTR62_008017 [Meristemomyces frigidus]|uniref:DUF7053 domain-containing protein n=1 Tax=Meristemomyces frigidus TaxID=1508187 RepID=A0AAN7YJ12_9PEZI|nr:hypothetical protein LTR62_008017 [Meristemomyces frigidus]